MRSAAARFPWRIDNRFDTPPPDPYNGRKRPGKTRRSPTLGGLHAPHDIPIYPGEPFYSFNPAGGGPARRQPNPGGPIGASIAKARADFAD